LDLLELPEYRDCELVTSERHKSYSSPCSIWTADEAFARCHKSANTATAGYDFAWECDGQGWSEDLFKIGGQWNVAKHALAAKSPAFNQVLTFADGGFSSIKCRFCKYLSHESCLPPEDVAIDVAVAVATSLSTAGQSLTAITANDVLRWGQEWRQISSKLGLLAQRGGCKGDRLAEAALPNSGSFEERFCQDLLPDVGCKVGQPAAQNLLEDLSAIKARLDERIAAALCSEPQTFEDWRPSSPARLQQMRGTRDVPFSTGLLGRVWEKRVQKVGVARVSSMTSLREQCIGTILRHNQFCSPIFALVGDVGPHPSWPFRQVADCKCTLPWRERSHWDRHPHVPYQLPPPTGPWKSSWLEQKQCAAWVLSVAAVGTPASGSRPPAAVHGQGIKGLHEPLKEEGKAAREGVEPEEEKEKAAREGGSLKEVDVEVSIAVQAIDDDGAEARATETVEDDVCEASVSDDVDIISWTSADNDDNDDLMRETSEDHGEEPASDESQEAYPAEPQRTDSGESEPNDQCVEEAREKQDRKREIKAELRALLSEGYATPPRHQRPTGFATWSDEKQPRPEHADISNASKVAEAALQNAPASGSDAIDVPHHPGPLANETLLAEVVTEASTAKIDGQDPPRIIRIGTNHDLQEVIRQVEKVRWVAQQQKLGKYRHLFEPLGGVPPDGYPDNYYLGLHRFPLPGLRDSICYSYSLGHIEACLIKRGDPEGSDGEPSSSSSYWEDDGNFIADEASALRRELQEFSDDSSLSPELDVDPSELDG